MAKLKLGSVGFFFFFYFLSLSSSEISKAPEVTPGDDLIILPSSNSKLTILPNSEASSELIPVDLTDVKEETDDLPGSASAALEVVSFHHHHHQDEDSHKDGGLRKSHHHHHHHDDDDESDDESDDDSDDEEESHEVEGLQKDRVGPPLGHWFHQQKFEGEDKHPFRLKSYHGRHHHHQDDDDDDKEEEEQHGEFEGLEKERVGPPLGHWVHQRKFGGEEEHTFHHKSHHGRRHHLHDSDDEEKEEEHGKVEGVEKERVGPPLGHWLHQQNFAEEQHPFHREPHHHHRHHHHDDDSDDENEEEEKKREKGGLLFKLRKFLHVF